MKGQVVVVTGGGSGLGQRLSELLAQKGAKLALIDVNQVNLILFPDPEYIPGCFYLCFEVSQLTIKEHIY